MDPQNVPVSSIPISKGDTSQSNFIGRIKNLSKKQKLIGLGVVVLLLLLGMFLYLRQNKTLDNSQTTIAKVGDTAISQRYLDLELSYYPGARSSQTSQMLTQKIIDDEITLQGAKKEGLINNYQNSPLLNSSEYLERTKQVQEVKKRINESANSISGKIVSLWVSNNGYIGPKGLEKGKEIAFSKIKPLYDQVKSNEITIEIAGERIKSDKSLKEIDPIWEVNAIAPFTFYKGRKATFWSEFDDMLWSTKEGELTPLYLGRGKDKNGVMRDELYIFAKVDKRITDRNYNNYADWLKQQRDASKITLSQNPPPSLPQVFAQEDGGGNGGNDQGSSGGGDNGPGQEDTHGLAVWTITVRSGTGAPVPGAFAIHTNGWGGSYAFTAGANGVFGFGPSYGDGCGANPHVFTIYAPASAQSNSGFITQTFAVSAPPAGTQVCGKKTISIANAAYEVVEDILCGPEPSPTPPPPSPSPTPPPPPACNKPCNTLNDCAGNLEGCLECRPNSQGQNTCQPPPPPACNSFCSSDAQCVKNTEGCTQCVAGQCRIPPACNVSCSKDEQCSGAKDGCTSCLPADSGAGKVCRKTPACNVACTRDDQCAGAKDGCTACVGGVCKIPPACGVACSTKADCVGARDGCSECLEGTCTNFNDNMCKCDGIDANLDYPNDFKFDAFGKVEGDDTRKAQIADVTFRLTRDNQVIAKSNPITPQITESTPSKVRFKASWTTPPPAVSKNSVYRVFADVRCKPKKIVASAAELANASLASSIKPAEGEVVKPFTPKGLEWLAKTLSKIFSHGKVNPLVSEVLAQLGSPSPSPSVKAQSNLQLSTLKFVKLMDTDNCRFVMFKFDETLF